MKSIRRYLLRSLILALIAGSLLVAAICYWHATDEIDDLYNHNMQDLATMLSVEIGALGVDQYGAAKQKGPSLDYKLRHEEEFLIQIWNFKGKLLYTSHRAIAFPMQEGQGITQHAFENLAWRSYILKTPNYQIQISQPVKVRVRFVRELAMTLLYPLLALIPIIGSLIFIAVNRSLLPLEAISSAIHQRSAASLKPLSGLDVPREVKPIIEELNAMLARLKLSLDTQRRFTADAAHELRSPLTALQLQLDILNRAKTEPERKHAAAKLQEGILRTTHLVRQLLTLARMEQDTTDHLHQSFDLAEILPEILARYAEQAAAKQIELCANDTQAAMVFGDPTAIFIAVSNLVDNALRYTDQAGSVELRTYVEEGTAVIEVLDNGIGIPAHERNRVLERFYRVVGSNTEGTGLGLSIADNIIAEHQGSMVISSGLEGKGTSVQIRLPQRHTST